MCCYWSSEPFSRASQPASQPALGHYPEGTIIIDPAVAGCISCHIACRRSSEPPERAGPTVDHSELQSRLHPTTTQGEIELPKASLWRLWDAGDGIGSGP